MEIPKENLNFIMIVEFIYSNWNNAKTKAIFWCYNSLLIYELLPDDIPNARNFLSAFFLSVKVNMYFVSGGNSEHGICNYFSVLNKSLLKTWQKRQAVTQSILLLGFL